ncbi:MAG: hypothetical protein JO112_20790 [Planctomycetes bacterium]|nr:hypothetical protein [Planctomycetota bacterium]
MTTGNDSPSDQDLRRWAAEQLGMAPDPGWGEVRTKALRRLPEVDFLPPGSWQEAVRVLQGSVLDPAGYLRAYESFLQEQEEVLRGEVEEFAAEFFRLPPSKRKERWQEWVRRCRGIPSLVERLRGLRPGLEVDPGQVAETAAGVRELAQVLGELFVLRPADRAAQRLEWLQRVPDNPAFWEKAARQLRKAYPKVEALEPKLVSRLASWPADQKVLARKRRRGPRWPFPEPASRKGGHKTYQRPVFWILIVAFIIIGAVALPPRDTTSNSSSVPTYYPPLQYPTFPKYLPPTMRVPDWEKLLHPPGTSKAARPPGSTPDRRLSSAPSTPPEKKGQAEPAPPHRPGNPHP